MPSTIPILKKLVKRLQPKRTLRSAVASFKAGTQGRLGKFANIDLDIDIGDIILGGRFKNKRIKVKKFGTDNLGQPTVNDRKLLSYRIEKKLPVSKQSSKTREGNVKTAEEAYQAGFQDEMDKLAFGVQDYYRSKGKLYDIQTQTYPGEGFKKQEHGPDVYGRHTYQKTRELKTGTPEYSRAETSVKKYEERAAQRKKVRIKKTVKRTAGVIGAGLGIAGAAMLAGKRRFKMPKFAQDAYESALMDEMEKQAVTIMGIAKKPKGVSRKETKTLLHRRSY